MQQIQSYSYVQPASQEYGGNDVDVTKTGDNTFLELLKSMARPSENDAPVQKSEQPVKKEQVAEKETELNEKDEEIPEDENNVKKDSDLENSYSRVLLYQSSSEDEQNQITVIKEISHEDTDASEKLSRITEDVSEKDLEWLLATEKRVPSEKNDEIDEELSALIENAGEFIPGNETDEEQLDKAQRLVISDPQKFLENTRSADEVSFSKDLKDYKKSDDTLRVKDSAGKKELKFTVHDFRTNKADNRITADEKAATKVQGKDLNLSYRRTGENQIQVTMDLSNQARENITSSSSQAAGAQGSTFQSMLSNAVSANAENFVKAGSIILKDNNAGQINMVLRPESLGNVKISLSLSDKVITGQITVQSQEAYEAMRENLDSLKQAFISSGFDAGEFNLNFAGQQNFADNGQNPSRQDSSFFAERIYGDFAGAAESAEREGEGVYMSGNISAVNIVA